MKREDKWMMTTYVVLLVDAVGIAKAQPRASRTSSQVQRRMAPLFAPHPDLAMLVLSSSSTAGLLGYATSRNDLC